MAAQLPRPPAAVQPGGQWVEGNLGTYNKDQIELRHSFKHTPEVARVLLEFSQVNDLKKSYGNITHQGFVDAMVKIAKALKPEFDEAEAEEGARYDWSTNGGGDDMTETEYQHTVFMIADVWLQGTCCEQYSEFLRMVLNQVTKPDRWGGSLWAHTADIECIASGAQRVPEFLREYDQSLGRRPGTSDHLPPRPRVRPARHQSKAIDKNPTTVLPHTDLQHTPGFLCKAQDHGRVPLSNSMRTVPHRPKNPEYVGSGWHTPRLAQTCSSLELSPFQRTGSSWANVDLSQTQRLASTLPQPRALAALPVIVRRPQVEKQALQLQVKQSGLHAEQLMNHFDMCKGHERAHDEEMRRQQQLSVKRAVRMVQHPGFREKRGAEEFNRIVAAEAQLRDTVLPFEQMHGEAYLQHAYQKTWNKRRLSVAGKAPHLHGKLPPKLRSGKIKSFPGMSKGPSLGPAAAVAEERLKAMYNEHRMKQQIANQQLHPQSLLDKRRGSTVGAVNAPISQPDSVPLEVEFDGSGKSEVFDKMTLMHAQKMRSELQKQADTRGGYIPGTPSTEVHSRRLNQREWESTVSPHFDRRESIKPLPIY